MGEESLIAGEEAAAVPGNPFARIRVRTLVLWNLLAVIVVMVPALLLDVDRIDNSELWVSLFIYPVTALASWYYIRRKGIALRWFVVAGVEPGRWRTALAAGAAFVALSLGLLYLVYIAVSYVTPTWVQNFLASDQGQIVVADAPLLSALMVVQVVLAAPVVEEFLFRGVILHRWAEKWSVTRAVIFSSIAFGALHAHTIGAFVTGFGFALLYVRFQSLLVPIAAHAVNNGIVVLLTSLSSLPGGDADESYTLAEFRADWWWGALGLAIAALIYAGYLRQDLPRRPWRLPPLPDAQPAIESA